MAVFGAVLAFTQVHAQEAGEEPATEAPAPSPAKSGGKSGFVKVLNGADQALYASLFKLAAKGDLAGIEAAAGGLKNKSLMGHVLARAYLASASNPSFDDLAGWMSKYASYPEASRIHALAKRKNPGGSLPDPERRIVRGDSDDGADLRSDISTDAGQAMARRVRSLLSDGKSGEAQSLLERDGSGLAPRDYNQLLAEIAGGLYYSGRYDAALALASRAAAERDHAPLADWIAGLANWRAKSYAKAAKHFEAMARQPEMTSWLRTAAAFWAGRSHILARQPQRAREMFEIGATKPRTFYGLLSLRLLGDKPSLIFREPALDPKGFQRVAKVPGVARAVALAQLGQRNLAEDVLIRAHGRLDRGLDAPFIALAADMGFAGAQFFAASAASSPELKGGSFPIMNVRPTGGFSIDPALIHAIIRQESRFDPDAESGTGARGLMQVLPSTAKLGEDPRGRLFEPVYNMTVGQNYIREMMRFTSPDGNLLQTAVAYNGGPGNLQKWLAGADHQDDPLLFIESLPSRETRGYVERVMANMWIYQIRMGKPTHTLDQLASGRWPMYGGDGFRSAMR
jgi:soluble lytic murein transglycosylase-like protein